MAIQALTETEIEQHLKQVDGWERDGGSIVKTFTLPSYMAGLAFASAIGTVCEALDHHPDLFIGWKKVRVVFTTHDAGSQISARDFDAAQAVEKLGYPKK